MAVPISMRRYTCMESADTTSPWYVEDAVPIVDGILARGRLPIVAGGTGLYIDNLAAGRRFAPFQPDHGIGGHHLPVQAQGQLRRQGGLTRGRGAADH